MEDRLTLYKVSEVSDLSEGLDFMLAHFIDPLWPRNVSTAATRNAQKLADSRDTAILYYEGALKADCRLACYPNYDRIYSLDSKTPISTSSLAPSLAPIPKPKPCHLFIDLDLASFVGGDRRKLDCALKLTLRNIKRLLDGASPTVLWSGGGYHLHQPLDPDVVPVFEELSEFKRYKDPSVQFMRYAEQVLTAGKADRNHRVSFASCMARIPASRNSKYEGETAEVRIVQAWDGKRARPPAQFLLTDFLIWLLQADYDAREKLRKQAMKLSNSNRISSNQSYNNSNKHNNIPWVEGLLNTPIPDWRKTAVALILGPYLLTIRKMSYEQAFHIIIKWTASCAQLSSLRPTERGFVDRVHASLERAQSRQSRPLKWSTLVRDYSQIYEMISRQAPATALANI